MTRILSRFLSRSMAMLALAGMLMAIPAQALAASLAIVAPRAQSVVSGTIRVVATAGDAKFAYAVVFIDGVGASATNTYPLRFDMDTARLSNGPHRLQLGLFDDSGIFAVSSPVVVMVSNGVAPSATPAVPKPAPAPATPAPDLTPIPIPVPLTQAAPAPAVPTAPVAKPLPVAKPVVQAPKPIAPVAQATPKPAPKPPVAPVAVATPRPVAPVAVAPKPAVPKPTVTVVTTPAPKPVTTIAVSIPSATGKKAVMTPATSQDKLTVMLDGKAVEFTPGAYFAKNRVMVMLRPLVNASNGLITWDGAKAIATINNHQVTITPNDNVVLLDGKTVTLDAPALNTNGRIWLPASAWRTLFGSDVRYTPEYRSVWLRTRDTMSQSKVSE